VNLPDVPAGTPCEVDRDKCTRDACNGRGFCVRGFVEDCDDGDKCTDDRCDRTSGTCVHVEDPSNDPICVPGPDLAIDKTAVCECAGPGPEPRSSAFKDGRWSDDVVFCLDGALDGRPCHIAFDITVTNTGGAGVTGVQVLDVLPPTVAFVGATASQGLYDLGTGVWDVGTLGSAGSALLTIDVATGSPGGALLAAGASRSDHGSGDDGSDDKSRDDKSDDKSGDDKSHDDKSHDDKSDDHGSHDSKSDDHSSHDSKSDDHSDSKSDDDSSDDVRGRIKNCADLIAVEPPDGNPSNDSDCVIVSLAGGGCHRKLPRWLGRCLDRSSRMLTAAARADSPERARRLLRRAERALDRANRGMAKLAQRGGMDGRCLDRLGAEVDGLADEARHLAP
jgi:uncharacterized repeat protein (TIGR01451 family)